jgi:HlyD family secretion protein
MKKILGILVLVILVASFIGTGFFLYKKSQKPPEVFETDSLFHIDIVSKTVATGSIVPRQEIALKSQVSGVVVEIFVEPGQIVQYNQKIARIKIIPDVVRLNEAEMRLKTATINLKNAETEMERQKRLYDDRVTSELDYNQFLLSFQLQKQEVEAAENNLELIREGASKKSGTASNLVFATAAGMVLDVPVKEGTFVIETNTFNEGTTIASVANMNEMIFEGKLDESEVGKIREGMDLKLKIGALDKEELLAKLEYISPKGVEEEGAIQFEIKAEVQLKKDVFIRAGYSANADIVLDQRDSVLAIKESNILFEGDKKYVEVLKGDQIYEKQEIVTGLSDGIHVELLDGLSVNDRIKKL